MVYPSCPDDSIRSDLFFNQNRCVTIYTTCACFCGLLTSVQDNTATLVDRCGRVIVCRIDDIEAIAFCP